MIRERGIKSGVIEKNHILQGPSFHSAVHSALHEHEVNDAW